MEMQQAIQHQNPPNIPVKNAENDQQCPPVRLQEKPRTTTLISRTYRKWLEPTPTNTKIAALSTVIS